MNDNIFTSDHFLFFDGGLGTMLQENGLLPGQSPDLMNLSHPAVVARVHKAYMDAGSDLICTNTFGTNRRNLAGTGHSVDEVVSAAVALAKQAAGGKAKVCVDIGPIGELMQPMGPLSFDAAYDMFREIAIAGEKAGADVASIETMADLTEMRAAILAVRENTSLPIFAMMTFERSGRTYLGTLPESFAMVAEGLGVTALGVNCSVGPAALLPTVKKLAQTTSLPLIVKPNAGLPDSETGVYSLSPSAFAAEMLDFAALGTHVVGGCCGTNPDYIRALRHTFSALPPKRAKQDNLTRVCTAVTVLTLDESTAMGISLLADAHDDFMAAVSAADFDTVLDLVNGEIDDGAMLLCVPAEFESEQDVQNFVKILHELQGFVSIPMAFRVKTPACLVAALRAYQGKACVLPAEDADIDALFDCIVQYGAVLMGVQA